MSHTTTLRRHPSAATGNPLELPATHLAVRGGRSIFPSRVFDADEVGRVLKDGHQSRKLGRTVQKGPRRGWPIFSLTLEERATCPRSCAAYRICYGNRMQAAERIVAGEALEKALWAELLDLQRAHSDGFLVRLHVLGDFYSVDYVDFWDRALEAFPALHVFGFTAHLPGTPIGDRIARISGLAWDRFAVRHSGLPSPRRGSLLQRIEGAMSCPAQSGKSECCATCALCWQSDRTIAFEVH